jgi:hypothetical protein
MTFDVFHATGEASTLPRVTALAPAGGPRRGGSIVELAVDAADERAAARLAAAAAAGSLHCAFGAAPPAHALAALPPLANANSTLWRVHCAAPPLAAAVGEAAGRARDAVPVRLADGVSWWSDAAAAALFR